MSRTKRNLVCVNVAVRMHERDHLLAHVAGDGNHVIRQPANLPVPVRGLLRLREKAVKKHNNIKKSEGIEFRLHWVQSHLAALSDNLQICLQPRHLVLRLDPQLVPPHHGDFIKLGRKVRKIPLLNPGTLLSIHVCEARVKHKQVAHQTLTRLCGNDIKGHVAKIWQG